MKKRALLALGFVVLIGAVLLFYPYNPYHYLTAEEKVTSIFLDPVVRGDAFGDDSDITNVKYLGNYIYHVETEEHTYLVKIKSSKSTHAIEVFDHHLNITQFRNY